MGGYAPEAIERTVPVLVSLLFLGTYRTGIDMFPQAHEDVVRGPEARALCERLRWDCPRPDRGQTVSVRRAGPCRWSHLCELFT